MIARLFRLAVSLVTYFCVATCIAEIVIVTYVSLAWQIDRAKLIRILAAAHGIDLAEASRQSETDQPPTEQVSLEQIIEARTMHVRHLELREAAVKNALDQLQFEQQKLADDRKLYDKGKKDFEARLLAVRQDAQSGGAAELTAILEKAKAKQAKEQILKMLDEKRLADVVILLSGMQDSKRAKIIGEFKTPEESAKLAEVLRRIREGAAENDLARETRKQLDTFQQGGSKETP